MFDFSLAELALIVIVAVVFIGPKELPVVIKTIAKMLRSARELMREIHGAFDDLAKESGVKEATDEILSETKMIQGDDGKLYESYSLDHFIPKPVILDEPKKEPGDEH